MHFTSSFQFLAYPIRINVASKANKNFVIGALTRFYQNFHKWITGGLYYFLVISKKVKKQKRHGKPPYKGVQILFTLTAISLVIIFGIWWFNPAHIPHNFLGTSRILDIGLFLLVSYVIWHSIMMDVLTWSIALHIKDLKKQKPEKGLKVAFITTIVPGKESLNLLHKCLPAMVKAKYPHDTWLLDEGNNPEVKAICQQYGVYHFSRAGIDRYNTKKGKFTKTKGGNHNAWYEEWGNNYDFVAQIDTDFLPRSCFLTKTLGYFKDPKVAFVGTPQIYGNANNSFIARGAFEQQFIFYGAVLRGLSSIGMTLLIGANHVIRVKEFQNVDHYTAHITEDLITGMKLHAQGLKSVYVPEVLAIGEGPASWGAYFTQQLRWAYGCIDILFHHSFSHLRKMKLRYALYYFFLQQHYFSGLAMALSIVLLSFYFIFGIRAANVDLLKFFLAYSGILILCWLMSVWLQRFDVNRKEEGEMLFAGKIVSIAAWPIWFLAFLSVITGKQLRYKVTPKGGREENTPSLAFAPHIFMGLVAGTGLVSSVFSHKQSIIMLFWAFMSATLMLSVPFLITGVQVVSKGRLLLTRLVGSILKEDGKAIETFRLLRLSKPGDFFTDCLFLFSIVILSCVLYVGKIGFYSDDWSFLGNFTLSKTQNFLGFFLTATTPNTFMRPMQNIYDALLFTLFRTSPLGYQLVNTGVFALIVIFLYAVLRKIGTPRIIAISVPLIFSLLPNYSTDRFWYASYQVNLSILLFLISLFAGLKAFAADTKKILFWKLVSIISMVLSALSYEIVLPLVFLNMFLFWNPFGILSFQKTERRSKTLHHAVFVVFNLLALIYIVLFKIKTTIRLGKLNYPTDAMNLVSSIFHTNFTVFIFNGPKIIGEIFTHYITPQVSILAALIFGLTLLYLLVFTSHRVLPNKRFMVLLSIIGLCVFILGYAIFLTNNRVGFSPMGIDNRVAIAATIGIALFLVGSIGFLSKLFLRERLSYFFFCTIISIVSAAGFLIINTLSFFWISAYTQSTGVIADIQKKFPEMPKNTTLILDGVCPYQGPGIVFESQWDLKGALQVVYHDPSLQADIVTPRLKVSKKSISTQIYTFRAEYPYKNVIIFNDKTKRSYWIKNAIAAKTYFKTYNPHFDSGCQIGSAGNGTSVL